MSDWTNYQNQLTRYLDLGFTIDLSRMDVPSDLETALAPEISRALADRKAIEAGEIMNPDEGRAVGHYWLRNASLAPADKASQITEVLTNVKAFAKQVHDGDITAPNGNSYRHVLLVGIGGSALGPQLVDKALRAPNFPVDLHFLDNTDPGGMADTFARLGTGISETLVLVVSKSGGTPETRNGMLEARAYFESQGLDFSKQAVAITGDGSKLDQFAEENGWVARFPMEDWVGGRTSVMSAVGLLPAALTGVDIDQFLAGAAAMDEKTRSESVSDNAALQLALMWHHAGGGKGAKDMVVIPYCDRMDLLSKYLQQLVMESLGKEFELGNEKRVNQGIAVYGNKGSTDQHAYVQQLRDGLNNFFLTFIEVGQTKAGAQLEVDGVSTTADFLQCFLRGTRDALYENDRLSITLTVDKLNAFSLGMLIALFERAVSFYASLVNINAYHQPGVEAGKKAAGGFLDLLTRVKGQLSDTDASAEQVASALGETNIETVYHCLNHLAATGFCSCSRGASVAEDSFAL
ncbi:MAG: glucose-6-phosphate isomerase [Verrucomicrobiota bacterium]